MSITRKTIRRMSFLSLVFVLLLILSTEARADLYELYGFEAISWNSPAADTMAAQLSLKVVDLGGDPYQVEFIFQNNIAPYTAADPLDPLLGIVTGLALEDGTLLGIWDIIPYPSGPGSEVGFVEDTTPPSGTWGLGFDTDTTSNFFRANANSPSPTQGVNPYEAVGIVFNLINDNDFDDVIAALNQGFTGPIDTGKSLRIGIHVQNLDPYGERSDAYILTPIPASVVLGMLGLGVAGLKLRKFT